MRRLPPSRILVAVFATVVVFATGCAGEAIVDLGEPAPAVSDAGAAAEDAGLPAPDAGPEEADAGAGEADAGEPVDAGAAEVDAGTPVDAGTVVEPWSFVVMGDNQCATSTCTSGVAERLSVTKAVVAARPTLVIHVGDLMDHGYEDGAYAKFKSCYSEMLAAVPFFPVPGNHDLGSGAAVMFRSFLEETILTTNPAVYGAEAWARDCEVTYGDDPTQYSTNPSAPANRPDLPSGFSFKNFYAFKFRNAYFVGLEAGTQWWTNTPKSWITKHLAAARADPSIDHVFVWLHHPLYSSTMDDDGTGDSLDFVRNAYDSIFRQYGVTAVFSGHVHLYDRFYVPDDDHSTRAVDAPPASYPRSQDAIHHITVGGAGGPLPNSCNPIPGEKQQTSRAFQQKRACGYHFLKVSVEGGKLTFDATQVTGSSSSYTTTAWDHFTVE